MQLGELFHWAGLPSSVWTLANGGAQVNVCGRHGETSQWDVTVRLTGGVK
jgi:hypothetical protein